MKKPLLIVIALLFNCLLAAAQNEPPLYEDFLSGVKDINTIVFNEHLNILQVNTDNENFDLIAVDDKMRVLWRNTFQGFALGADKFKDKIVAVVSTDHSYFKGSNNTFRAYVVDPANGKLLIDKVVYTGSDEYMSYPQMSTGKGNLFKLAIRQSAVKRKLHVALPGPFALFTLNTLAKEFNETTDLQVVDLNEKLEPVNSFKPAIANGSFVSATWNKKGDMFISWFNGPTIDVFKYEAGKTAPSAQMTASVAFEESKTAVIGKSITFLPAENSNVLYYGTLYKNEYKDIEMGVGKLDFSNNKKSYVPEVLDKAALKDIKKSFVPVNKDLDDVDMGYPGGLKLRFVEEHNGKIVTGVSSESYSSSSIGSGGYITESALLITGYDLDLKQKFETLVPSGYTVAARSLNTGYHLFKNKLYVVANNKSGLRTMKGMYGQLDLGTGQWDSMALLSKKHIGSSDFIDGSSIMWFGDGYIIPYCSPKGLSGTKYNITLQQNTY